MNTEPIDIEPIDEDSQFFIDQLYLATPTKLVMPGGLIADVPETGNIALLALGYRGIIAWRKKRDEVFGERIYSPYLEILKNNHKQKEAKEMEGKNGG